MTRAGRHPTDPRAETAQLRVLERNVPLLVAGLSLLALGPLATAAFFAWDAPWGLFGVPASLGGLWATVGTIWGRLRARARRRQVRFTEGGIEVDGALRVPTARIQGAFYQPRSEHYEHGSTVRVLGASRTLLFEAEVHDEARAVAFLRAMGLDTRSRRASFTAAPPFVPAWLGGVPLLGAAVALAAAALPMRIVVGSDGLLFEWLWWERFVPMGEISAVGASGQQTITIALRSGATDTVHTSAPREHAPPGARLHRDAVLARIQEAHRAFANEGSPDDVAGLVARGARSTPEWLRALEALARGGGGYREVSVRDEDLLRLVEDSSAPEAARAGAAIALRGREAQDEEARARVRVAAEATASPRLRVALEAALGEGDASLEVALDALDDAKAERAE